MPKVSFILPAYKRRFLKEAIASILAQTYKDLELVIVDDHSPEGLKDVVDQFSDPRLTYYCNEENLGGKDLVAAWEKAMTYARGEWCVLASDDDLYHPEYLSEMLRLTEQYPQVNAVHSRVGIIDHEGRITGFGQVRSPLESAIEMVYSRSICRYQQTMPDFMFRLEEFNRNGGFVKFPVAWYSDDATWAKLAKRGGVAFSPRVLFYFRYSGINISSTNSFVVEKMNAGYQYCQWVLNFIKELVPQSDEERRMIDIIQTRIEEQCLDLIRYIICPRLALRRFLPVLKKATIPSSWKKRIVKDRIARLLNIRTWLPF